MPKIRALKPSFFTDESVVELSPLARLLYQGMWCHACDNGHLADKPRQLKLRILPADDCSVPELLNEIEAEGMIERHDGWIIIRHLTEHQRPDKRYFLTCEYPGCSDCDAAENATRSARFGNHKRWHEGRGLVDPECEFCPSEPTDEDEPDDPSAHRVHVVATSGPRRAHDVSPSGPRRGHIADGDGDGDGDGDTKTSSSEIASDLDGPPKTDPDEHPRPEVSDLCQHLADRVRTNGHHAKVGKLWHRACRLLIDRDGHTPEQIRAAIDWATADPFWSTNIRSMANLREKYTTLQAQAKSKHTRPQYSNLDALAEARRRLEAKQNNPLIVEGQLVP